MKTLKIKTGLFFPRPFILLAYVGMGFGIYATIFESPLFIVLFLVSTFIAFAPQIVEIDVENKRIRNALSFLSYGAGKWKSYKDYPYISLLSANMVEKTYGGRTLKAVSTKERYYEIYLLGENHLKKILLISQNDKEKAIKDFEFYADKLNLKKVNYKPKLSERSLKRKRDRKKH